jgi:hypothetical protein
MNIQEREQLTMFLQQLARARVDGKDSEADALISETCRRQPDAAYLLVQRSLLQEQALANAQEQIARLRSELDAARPAGRGGFLGDANTWGNSAPPAGRSTLAGFPPLPAAPSAPQSAGGWGSGWLGNMATTAAGVVAGSFLFQGIEHLIGNHNDGWMSGESGLQPAGSVTDNTVLNNYNDGAGANGAAEYDLAALDADITDDVGDVI